MHININNLTMTYPSGKQALKDINLNLETPNLIGLLGPNGAGKSTLMKLLVAGLIATEGSIDINGTLLNKCEKQLKSKLGYLPQEFGLFDDLTVWQFLDYMAALKEIKNSKLEIEKVVSAVNLEEKKNVRIRRLSGGQRQRVGIAQALLGSPEFLILDEPTVGLDPEERINLRNFFSKTAQDKLVLLSTHIIEDIQSVCNRLIVLNKGKILFDGTPKDLIYTAKGHVGTFLQDISQKENSALHITSRVNTADGIACRAVAQALPSFAKTVEPSLEDAYMYLIASQEGII